MKENGLKFLERDHVLHMSMIFPIIRGTADILYAGQDGVFLRETESNVYMINVEDFSVAKKLVDKVGKQAQICVYQKDTADYLHEKHCHKKYVKNVQAVYRKPKCVMNTRLLDIQPLNLSHLNLVHKHFDYLEYNYLQSRLECGAIFGGVLNGEFFGFIGTHAEGAMGILKVIEKFRGQGLALELGSFMVNNLIGRGEVPYSQIEYDNEASIVMHKKLGFDISSDTIYRLIDWVS